MKIIRFLFILVLFTKTGYCQDNSETSNAEMAKQKQQLEKEITQLKKELESKEYLTELEKKITIEFTIDTFRIEKLLSNRLELDYSTAGMANAINNAEIEYDKLLNKYFQTLIKKLNESDKEILKLSQRNWITFRDSEKKLNVEISKKEYSGGGTIQQLTVSEKKLNITKKRVLELFEYLTRIEK